MTGVTIRTRPAPQPMTVIPERDLQPGFFVDYLTALDCGGKTRITYQNNLKQFWAWLCFTSNMRPTREDVIRFRDWLGSEHEAIRLDPSAPEGWAHRTDGNGHPLLISCAPNTVKQYIRSVGAFFKSLAALGIYPDITAEVKTPKVRHDAHRKEYLTAPKVQAIESSITEKAATREAAAAEAQKDRPGRIQRSGEQGARLLALYTLAVNAGLRCVELSRANVRDLALDGDRAFLYIWGKGHTEPDQRKAIAPEVAAIVKKYLATRTDNPTGASPLFVSTGNRSGGRRIAPTTISKMLKAAMREAGFDSDRLTAHSLRHSAGQAVMDLTGQNLFATQMYMRHADPATTEIYLHHSNEDAEAGIAQRLFDHYHGRSGGADLAQAFEGLNRDQLEQLAGIAAAMRR